MNREFCEFWAIWACVPVIGLMFFVLLSADMTMKITFLAIQLILLGSQVLAGWFAYYR